MVWDAAHIMGEIVIEKQHMQQHINKLERELRITKRHLKHVHNLLGKDCLLCTSQPQDNLLIT